MQLSDNPVHHKKQSDGDGISGTCGRIPGKDQSWRDRWLEVRTAVCAAASSNQPERLPHDTDTIWCICKYHHISALDMEPPQISKPLFFPPLTFLSLSIKSRLFGCLAIIMFYFSSSWPLAILRNPLNCSFPSCWLPIPYETKMAPCAARQKPSTPPRSQSSDRGWTKKTCDNQPQMRTMKTLVASNCSHDLSPAVKSLSCSSSTFL